MCWITALLPLGLGLWTLLQNSPEPFALGMVAGVLWFAITRVVPEDIEQGLGILPLSMIKSVNNLREPEADCCGKPELYTGRCAPFDANNAAMSPWICLVPIWEGCVLMVD